ncbi:hypothetical protein ACIPVK_03560 [Paeniglutamicibacter sp. MACA_103]|uniref:hypothetical protein n=1 Tax=Paeniglutamicibacter sp. MACA_103 TaxID=3377337 RepID=UPI003894B965
MTSLFAAFHIADGTVISELHRRHRAVVFQKFVAIDNAAPRELGVHLVCDNLAAHETRPSTTGWRPSALSHAFHANRLVLDQPGRTLVRVHHRPVAAPRVRKSVPALERDVKAWIETWNDDPKPFVWEKTAEEILKSLAKYIERFSGAELLYLDDTVEAHPGRLLIRAPFAICRTGGTLKPSIMMIAEGSPAGTSGASMRFVTSQVGVS